MSEWEKIVVGQYADVLSGFAFKSDDFSNIGTPIIKIKNVASGKLEMNEVQYYPLEINNKIKKYLLKKKDILIAMTGSHVTQPSSMVGKVCRYELDKYSLLNQRVGKIYSTNIYKLNEDFLFYFFKQNEITIELATSAGGSANQANISPSQIKSLYFLLPSLEEQNVIASILSSLDDKIDLLHRQNKTLEALAETLFRQWFVDEAEERREIALFSNYVQFIKGKKPNDAVDIFVEGLFPQILIETFDTGKTLYSDPKNMIIANEYDILMVMDGASSGRIEIGYTGIVGSTIGLFKPVPDFDFPLFLFYFLKNNENHIKDNTTGSAIPHADKELILNLVMKYSNMEKVKDFETITERLFVKKQSNKKQIRTLTQLRDTLLPKLMSGEVRVGM